MSTYSPGRQYKTAGNNKERELRNDSARQLIHELIGDHREEFSNPQTRLDFFESLTNDEMYAIASHINLRMRGMDSSEIRNHSREAGARLPLLYTPPTKDKTRAFERGFDAIREYIHDSDDPTGKKLEGVSLGLEGLIVRVHPFNDGNGRTSRFLAEFCEHGCDDIEHLITSSSSNSYRDRIFSFGYMSKENALAQANNTEIMLEEEDREKLRKKAQTLPNNAEAMHHTIKAYLENDDVRKKLMLQDK